MKGLKRLGAMTLAAALSITMIAPITANAEVIQSWEVIGGEKYSTFTDEDTNQSISQKDFTIDESADGYSIVQKKNDYYTMAIDTYNEVIALKPTKDVARYENFKTNKKALKCKVLTSYEYSDPAKANEPITPDYEDKDPNGYVYYRNYQGEITKVAKADKDNLLPKGDGYAYYEIRLYTKKAGTYKLSYDMKLKNGTTVKRTIKVIAKEDGAPIKEVTFDGKTLIHSEDAKTAADFVYKKGYGYYTTSAKSGKLRVTMNKDFKLKKIEIGTPSIETVNENGLVKTKYKDGKSDLDYANPLSDQGPQTCTWKKVKNGKKIKLANVDTRAADDELFKNGYDSNTTKVKAKNTTTTTYIRITYFDKKNKTTGRIYCYILRAKK